MVKTDGGSNMVANTFMNNIPSWNQEEETLDTEADHPSADPDVSPNEDMVEIELPASEDDPLWVILQENGVNLAQLATLDEDEQKEAEEVVAGLEQMMPSSASIQPPTGDSPVYRLEAKLRSDCTAHKLQLVVKDGFKSLTVCIV